MDAKTIQDLKSRQSISIKSAQKLSITTNTIPQIVSITPRWLLRMLPWVYVDSGIYRVNQVKFLIDTHERIKIERDDNGNIPITTDLLRSIYLLQFVPETVLNSFIKKIKVQEVSAGDIIVKQNEAGDNFYIILEGDFDVSLRGRHDVESVVATLSDGDFFGEMVLLQNIPRTATVTATTKGTLLCLGKKDFHKLIESKEVLKKLKDAYREREKGLELVDEYGEIKAVLKSGHTGEPHLSRGYIEYDENPKEIHLSVIQSIIGIHTRISDIYNVPFNQLEQQIRVTVENIREREEWEIINNREFGLLHNITPEMSLNTRKGPPTPDDFDDLLSLVWKKPSFFLAHPRAVAAFGRECTQRGVPPKTVEILGGNFLTWRGIPIIPSNKLNLEPKDGSFSTSILLMRAGETDQGVVGLYKGGNEKIPGLAIHYMGINDQSIASYLVNKYFSVAILVRDAIGALHNVEVGHYHDYTE